ncbi:MAG: peroxidase family protein [Pirellula sp.]|jgi:hypothetical protein
MSTYQLPKRLKPVVFLVLSVAVTLFVTVAFIYSIRGIATLYAAEHARYSTFLAMETILCSVAFALFTFYRQHSPFSYERIVPSHTYHFATRNRNIKVTWLGFWFAAWITFVVPTAYEMYSYGISGVVRMLLALWWTCDLLIAAWELFSSKNSARLFVNRTDLRDTARDKQIRWQRSWLSLIVFLQCFISTIITNSILLWFCFLIASSVVLLSLVIRIVVQPFDSRTMFGQVFLFMFRQINRVWNWDTLPVWVGVANLAALREELRERNLISTSEEVFPVTCLEGVRDVPAKPADASLRRLSDGCFNDPASDTMGISSFAPAECPSTVFTHSHPDARFGRNMPLQALELDQNRLMVPNPREISCKLLARDVNKPNHGTSYATSINLLAAAWIQFQTHDWFSHGEPIEDDPYKIDTSNDPSHDRWPSNPMLVRRTRPDPTRQPSDKLPMTFTNSEAHWWDASQIYGTQPTRTQALLSPQCPFMPSIHSAVGPAKTGFFDNWWIGLGILHELFVKEHNAICCRLRREYPSWSNELIFEKARLINAALLAKIHTIEWTPAILNNRTLQISMNANWSGLFTQRVIDAFGRLGWNEAFWGIPNSGINHHTAPYSLTEEFVSVYRMHSLIPDEITLRSVRGDKTQTFSTESGKGIVGEQGSLHAWNEFSQADLLFSFGNGLPGSLTLNNFPNSLRRFLKPGSNEPIDIATIDILRDRERHVPRYNRFRKELRMRPIQSFDEFNTLECPDIARRLREVYKPLPNGTDCVDDLDLLIGTLAESKPEGFGFSDTTFRIFILMASRRLKSDRFTAEDFTPEIYTQIGIDWVNYTSMNDVLTRHYPELSECLYRIDNAFKPWKIDQ